ncbi:MAG TPA: glycosyltransferase family 39 protein [Panacibacter sp.]|nr:glycosyltransferase family 39 protein [Panacibacter sp.]HNP43299.1 glycosyltransferase family 39 protein [Panacibacter sp.]
MINSNTYKPFHFLLLLTLLAVVLLFRLGATPIYILDEVKNAQCAKEMMHNNNLVVPTFNGELRTDKPPLHYFFMIVSYKVFGETEFAARFFSVVMGLLTVFVTFFYTKRHSNAFHGFCAALVLACSTHFLFEFRLSVPDPYLIFFITLGLFSGFTWLQESKVVQLYLAAFALGMATLAKGPVALALPGLCLLVWVVITKKWKTAFTWHLIPAFLLLCVVTIPWYYAVDKATDGAWTKGFFIDNNLNRFSDPQEGHGGFFFVTLLFVLIGLLPFMSFLGGVVKERKALLKNDLVKFGSIVVLAFVVFFSVSSTKLPNYPMPCYPFAALVLGSYVAGILNRDFIPKKFAWYFLLGFSLLLPVAAYVGIKAEPATTALSVNVATMLTIAGLILLAGTFISKRDWPWKIEMIIIAFTALNIIGLGFVYPGLYSENPVAKTINIVKQSTNVITYGIFNPGYRFYMDKNLPRSFSSAELQHLIDSTGSGIIITRVDHLDSLKAFPLKELARERDIFELPTTVILQYNAKP